MHVNIVLRDMTPDPATDEITDRVATKPYVFEIQDWSLEIIKMHSFPTIDDFKQEQIKECTDEIVQKLKLRRSS